MLVVLDPVIRWTDHSFRNPEGLRLRSATLPIYFLTGDKYGEALILDGFMPTDCREALQPVEILEKLVSISIGLPFPDKLEFDGNVTCISPPEKVQACPWLARIYSFRLHFEWSKGFECS